MRGENLKFHPRPINSRNRWIPIVYVHKDSRIKSYQDYFLQFNWFQPLLIGLAGLLILIGLILY